MICQIVDRITSQQYKTRGPHCTKPDLLFSKCRLLILVLQEPCLCIQALKIILVHNLFQSWLFRRKNFAATPFFGYILLHGRTAETKTSTSTLLLRQLTLKERCLENIPLGRGCGRGGVKVEQSFNFGLTFFLFRLHLWWQRRGWKQSEVLFSANRHLPSAAAASEVKTLKQTLPFVLVIPRKSILN